jgi:hypothetical protein
MSTDRLATPTTAETSTAERASLSRAKANTTPPPARLLTRSARDESRPPTQAYSEILATSLRSVCREHPSNRLNGPDHWWTDCFRGR